LQGPWDVGDAGRFEHRLGEIFGQQQVGLAEDDGALDRIFQFANVAGP
jgi:hypothetical protein